MLRVHVVKICHNLSAPAMEASGVRGGACQRSPVGDAELQTWDQSRGGCLPRSRSGASPGGSPSRTAKGPRLVAVAGVRPAGLAAEFLADKCRSTPWLDCLQP